MKLLYFQKYKNIILSLICIIIVIYRLFNLQNINNKIVNIENIETFEHGETIEYDIIYSYTCHEDINSFLDTLKNLFYFNKSQKILVIINPNDIMYNELKDKVNTEGLENIKLYPLPSTKRIYTYDILNAHIQNFSYCIDNNFKSKYFILLASNCLFHKSISMLYIENIINNNKLINVESNYNVWNWPDFFKNKKICDIFIKNKINKNDFIKSQHEGFILEYEVMNKIKTFIIDNNIKDNVENETTFEEILPITLNKVFTGKLPVNCCKVFWDIPNMTPSLEDINNEELPCIKRVERNYDNYVRKSIREQNNNYNS
jgi:hypothetical protein